MSDNYVIECCSPTLAGIKSGNLFIVKEKAGDGIKSDIRLLNRRLNPKGIRVLPLKYCRDYTLIYLYRPGLLKETLSRPEAIEILKEIGYSCKDTNSCIIQLIGRLNTEKNFPHEIGLFLDYPPDDVRGFMKNAYQGVKCVGCWKVYGDEKEALKTFTKYNRCTKIFLNMYKNGKTLEELSACTV